jgi:hypothetical protein
MLAPHFRRYSTVSFWPLASGCGGRGRGVLFRGNIDSSLIDEDHRFVDSANGGETDEGQLGDLPDENAHDHSATI